MQVTSDPNILQPLTELANLTLHEHTRKLQEFATSSYWSAGAVVVYLAEHPGRYDVRLGFELRTPVDFSMQDIVSASGLSKEEAVRNAVDEWLLQFLRPAMAIHSDKDPDARLGETTIASQQRIITWRMAEGPVLVHCADHEEANQVTVDLSNHPLFDRLNLGAILPFRQEGQIMCIKMMLERTATPGEPIKVECKINDDAWPAGLEMLKRFNLPKGSRALTIKQYFFIRRTGKRAMAKPPPTAPTHLAKPVKEPAAAENVAEHAPKKPWWKVW